METFKSLSTLAIITFWGVVICHGISQLTKLAIRLNPKPKDHKSSLNEPTAQELRALGWTPYKWGWEHPKHPGLVYSEFAAMNATEELPNYQFRSCPTYAQVISLIKEIRK